MTHPLDNMNWEALTNSLNALGRSLSTTARSFRKFGNAMARVGYTDGDRHIERIIKDILAGNTGPSVEVRLLCASDMAQIIDKN